VNDPHMHTSHGPSDAPYDYRDPLLAEIKDFGRIRRIPEFPDADYSPAGIEQWKAWLAKYQEREFSKPVSEDVADPYLQCLVRKAEWGFPDAILDISSSHKPDAVAVLNEFPTPKPGQPMGARKLFSEISRSEDGRLDPAREMQGNIEVALAMLGDEQMAAQIHSELEDFPYNWDYVPLEAVRKLKYIGGWRAVDTLVDALDNLRGLQKEGEQNLAQCMTPSIYTGLHPTPAQQENMRKYCNSFDYFRHVDEVNALILQTLAQIVKDPPLPADAHPTPENLKKWKDWWNENKDRASFVMQRNEKPLE